jgi:hypothetical protein
MVLTLDSGEKSPGSRFSGPENRSGLTQIGRAGDPELDRRATDRRPGGTGHELPAIHRHGFPLGWHKDRLCLVDLARGGRDGSVFPGDGRQEPPEPATGL